MVYRAPLLFPFAPLSFWVKACKNESMHLCNKMYPDISEQTTRMEHIELKSECWVYFQVKKNNWDWPINQTMDPCSHSDARAIVQQHCKSKHPLLNTGNIQGWTGLSSRQGQGVAVDENKVLVVEVQLKRGKDDTGWLCKCSISEKKEIKDWIRICDKV